MCPQYKYKSDDGKNCISDNCGQYQRMLANGRCVDCPEGSKADTDLISCIQYNVNETRNFNKEDLDEPVIEVTSGDSGPPVEEDKNIWENIVEWVDNIEMTNKNLMMIIIIGTGFLICLLVFCRICCCKTKLP